MPAAPSEEYDIVQSVRADDGAMTVIVGEYHDSVLSQRLVRTVLQQTAPVSVAVELCPERYTRQNTVIQPTPEDAKAKSRSVRTAWEYARDRGLPLYLVDERLSSLPVDSRRIRELYHDHDPPHPASDGDVSLTAIRRFRTSLAENQAQYFDAVLNRRERIMAGYLRSVAQKHDDSSTVVAILGAAHVESVAKKMHSVSLLDVPNERVIHPRVSPT